MLWKTIGAAMKAKELGLHLQGLYAELGRTMFERFSAARGSGKPSPEAKYLMEKIAEMRKELSRITTGAGIPPRKDRRKAKA